MLRPGKNARIGTQIILRDANGKPTKILATVTEVNDEGHRRLKFSGTPDIRRELDSLGEIPLPPYIERKPFAGRRQGTLSNRLRPSLPAPSPRRPPVCISRKNCWKKFARAA